MNKIPIAILDDEDICYDLLERIEKKEKVQAVYRSSTGSLRYGSLEITNICIRRKSGRDGGDIPYIENECCMSATA